MNNKKIDSMADRISEEISNTLADVMRPVFENLTKEISMLVAGLENRQKDSMESMADAFLQKMEETSGSMFGNITAGTAEICRMQSDTVKELSAVVDKMAKDMAAIRKMSIDNAKTADRLTEVSTEIDDKLDRLSDVSRRIEHMDKAGSMVNESIGNAMVNLDKCTERLENISKEVEASYEKMNDNVHNMMQEYRELVSKDMNDTFVAFDKGMSEIVKTLGTSVADIADAADRIPKALKGSIDTLQNLTKH